MFRILTIRRARMVLVVALALAIWNGNAFAWNPGQPEWRKSWTLLASGQPEYAKRSGHPYFTNRAIAYLARIKGMDYYNAHLADYGGAVVFGSSLADKYKAHGEKETACVETAVAHGGKPCPDFFEKKWGQVMLVQADRAMKTAAELYGLIDRKCADRCGAEKLRLKRRKQREHT